MENCNNSIDQDAYDVQDGPTISREFSQRKSTFTVQDLIMKADSQPASDCSRSAESVQGTSDKENIAIPLDDQSGKPRNRLVKTDGEQRKKKPIAKGNKHGDVSSCSKPRAVTKNRSIFTVYQVCELERCFAGDQYLSSYVRQNLARSLSLSEIQVKTWFQNRRMKLKKKRVEATERYAKLNYINGISCNLSPGQHSFHSYQPEYPPPSSPIEPPCLFYSNLPQQDCACSAPSYWIFPPRSVPFLPEPSYGRFHAPYSSMQ